MSREVAVRATHMSLGISLGLSTVNIHISNDTHSYELGEKSIVITNLVGLEVERDVERRTASEVAVRAT